MKMINPTAIKYILQAEKIYAIKKLKDAKYIVVWLKAGLIFACIIDNDSYGWSYVLHEGNVVFFELDILSDSLCKIKYSNDCIGGYIRELSICANNITITDKTFPFSEYYFY